MDNTQLQSGAGGDTIRTLDKTGTGAPKTEVVALDLGGGDGRSEAIASFPLPVKLDDVPVDDDGTPFISLSPSSMDALEMLFRQTIAACGYALTAGEKAAGVTVTQANIIYAPYNVMRYGADPTGTIASNVAFNNAYNAAMAASPHGAIYIPVGTYVIAYPGLTWTNQNDITVSGDGPNQSVLVSSNSPSYTILTISADKGLGTTGLNVNLSNFGIKNYGAVFGVVETVGGTHGLLVADYLYFTLNNILIQSSGDALTLSGVAQGICWNLNLLTWEKNSAGNTAMRLQADTLGIDCGPIQFSGSEFVGAGNITIGGAVNSHGSFGTTFMGCQFDAYGPAMATAVEFSNGDDVTLIECYSESSVNTTANGGSLFYLGRAVAPVNFTMIGGHFYNGTTPATFNLQYGLTGAKLGNFCVINTIWANFTTCAFNLLLSAGTAIRALNNSSQGGGATVFGAIAGITVPSGGQVSEWTYPGTAMLTAGVNTTGQIVNGATNTGVAYLQQLNAGQAAGFSFGQLIQAGTNASDVAWSVTNAAGAVSYGRIVGDGSGWFGYNGTGHTITCAAAGNVTIAAPTSGAALTLAAGTATVEPLLLTSGTNLTTALAGATEYDGTCKYFTPFATNRSVVMTEAVQCISGAYTLASQTAAQKLLNATANGAITLPIGVYEFECAFTLTAMSASSGSFGFALGGSSTHTDAWWATADKPAALATASTTAGTTFNTAANTTLVAVTTNTIGWARVRGIIRVTVAGTIIPQVSLGVAAAAVVGANSFFRILPVGPSGFTTVGQWT